MDKKHPGLFDLVNKIGHTGICVCSGFLLWFCVETNVRIGNIRRNYIC